MWLPYLVNGESPPSTTSSLSSARSVVVDSGIVGNAAVDKYVNHNINIYEYSEHLSSNLLLLEEKRQNSPSYSETMDWRSFSSGLSGDLKELKMLFHTFVSMVITLLGENNLGHELLYSTVYAVFTRLSVVHRFSNIPDVKKDFESTFGVVPDRLFHDQLTICQKLKADRARVTSYPEATKKPEAMVFPDIFAELNHARIDTLTKSLGILEDYSAMHLIPSDSVLFQQVEEEDEEDEVLAQEEELKPVSIVPGSYRWLLRKCEPYCTFDKNGHIVMSEEVLCHKVLDILQSTYSAERKQSNLLDQLGFEAIELLSDIFSFPNLARLDIQAEKDSMNAEDADYKRKLEEQRKRKQSSKPKIGNLKLKAQKKADRLNDELINSLAGMKFSGENDLAGLPKELPQNTVRLNTPKYEKVIVPPLAQEALPEEDRISTDAVDMPARRIFGSISKFNTLQSKVFDCAYKTANNMLVCAPTGAGKTNVALLTIAREIMMNVDEDGILNTQNFKVVYVAPMKALAQEIAEKFQKALSVLGVRVRELTGDMQLTKAEIQETQVLVVTPEKWDVITRKTGDNSLMSLVKLLIIDEVHLLHEDRGPVIEILVARTHRYIETTQQACRIVGLSATLPNYRDVASFLLVPEAGLFFFDSRYRPVPLAQTYYGLTSGEGMMARQNTMNEICYDEVVNSLGQLHQVMIFVTSRKETLKTAQTMLQMSRERQQTSLFDISDVPLAREELRNLNKVSNTAALKTIAADGVGVHHAGMTRGERQWVEKAFLDGRLSVLVCTATLAWGVNLPAHTVIVKGTSIYDTKRGGWVDMGMADVMQIFGRAGRPQFDTFGEAFLISTGDAMRNYLRLLVSALPIESQMIKALADHQNAEIVLGTVMNLREAESWLTYTYLYCRMLRNPTAYGVPLSMVLVDPTQVQKRKELILDTAKILMECKMIKFDYKSGNFYPTEVGRVASMFYLHHLSVDTYNKLLKPYMRDEEVVELLAHSREFSQLKVTPDDQEELLKAKAKGCLLKTMSGLDSYVGKANILIQCYLSQLPMMSPTLQSDSYFIQQNLPRIARALFELCMKKNKASLTSKMLEFSKAIERRVWSHLHPLRQFESLAKSPILNQQESRNLYLDELVEMSTDDLSHLLNCGPHQAKQVMSAVSQVPWLSIESHVQPLTRDVAKVVLQVRSEFKWNSTVHHEALHWWVWVEEPSSDYIYHSEQWTLTREMCKEEQKIVFTIPLLEPLPEQYIVRICSDQWLGSDVSAVLSLRGLMLPEDHPPHTDLLPLQPLPVTALQNPRAQRLYNRFTHFNPVQTQLFHTLYHTDESVFLGAPTGSGKTVVAELAILRALTAHPGCKVVYIAPMKALVRERALDWNGINSLRGVLGCSVVELTGDQNPDPAELNSADLLVTTPEKWDGLTRQWQFRGYIRAVVLAVIDEIHLLGQDRGPVLEATVSRMRYISSKSENPLRIVGLSTALSNAHQVGRWMGASAHCVFNFHPVMRPVPLSIFIAGYPGKHYCPRMATMNKPTYIAITTHSPEKPVLVFVSSRRQTRLTGMDLVSYAAADGNPRRFVKTTDAEIAEAVENVEDQSLKYLLHFGIGMHHAGLSVEDRNIVEALFVSQKIQVLICTSTLAWGVNFPAHLVVIKGTEYFDAKVGKYVDFPITDVLQMMGRAGRPQFDQSGKAVVLVHEPKKAFYHKFLHSPFPVESSLHEQLHNHVLAEIAQGTIQSLAQAIDWLSWTFLFSRLLTNPSYYGLQLTKDQQKDKKVQKDPNNAKLEARLIANNAEDISVDAVNAFLFQLLGRTMNDLEQHGLIEINKDTYELQVTSAGILATYYYIDYRTAGLFMDRLTENTTFEGLLELVCGSEEYSMMPVRHNEDLLNAQVIPLLTFPLDKKMSGNPHVKTSILLQSRWLRIAAPIADYVTDTLSALSQSVRISHALVDICADAGWLETTLQAMILTQSLVQGRLPSDHNLANLPRATPRLIELIELNGITTLVELAGNDPNMIKTVLQKEMGVDTASSVAAIAAYLPRISMILNPGKETYRVHRGYTPDAAPTNQNIILQGICGETVTFPVRFCRLNVWKQGSAAELSKQVPQKVIGPNDVKVAKEGWWLVVGSEQTDELYALKKVSIGLNANTTSVELTLPEVAGTYTWEVILMSDCYLGFDQQYSMTVIVTDRQVEEESQEQEEEQEEDYPDFL